MEDNFYVNGKMVKILREDSETFEFYNERVKYILANPDVDDIDKYAFCYCNKLFYGVTYNVFMEETLEMIENLSKKPSDKIEGELIIQQKNIDYVETINDMYKGTLGNVLILSQSDELFTKITNKKIVKVLKDGESIMLQDLPSDQFYDTIIIYMSLPLIERPNSLFLFLDAILSKDGRIIIIDPLIITNDLKDQYTILYQKLYPEYKFLKFYRPITIKNLVEQSNFKISDQNVNIVDLTSNYLIERNLI